MNESTDELLATYRRIQDSEGLTIEAERAIARAQGKAWRAYIAACKAEGIDPESPDRQVWPW